MIQLFQILAVVLAGVAAIFFWQENSDWAFASTVLACCSFFLSLRFQYKARIKEREITAEPDESPDENDLDSSN